MKKRTSIHDIARYLKVSATTVSFVLNGKAAEKKISTALEQKILEYVAKIGYRPNHIAQSLRTGKSKIIGMLVEDISDPFFSGIARIIEESLYKLGYKIFHSSTNNNTERAKTLLQIFRERQVDGYIIAPSPGIEDDIMVLLKDGKPVILFDRYFPGLDTTNIVIDNLKGAYDATIHLIQNGYKNVAFITLDSKQNQMMGRLRGYKKAIKEHKFHNYTLKIDFSQHPEKETGLIKKFLTENKQIDAVLFATNYLAINGLAAIRQMGLKMPEDIGMVGFDDNSHFALFSPSITAVAQPIQEISKQTVDQLIAALTGIENSGKRKTIVLPSKLSIRQSSQTSGRINNKKSVPKNSNSIIQKSKTVIYSKH